MLPDIFRGIRIGVVTFFGVFVPGVWYWASIAMYFIGITSAANLETLSSAILRVSIHPTVYWIVGFVVVYIAGCLMRAQSPALIDCVSIRITRCRRFGRWAIGSGEQFPYLSLADHLLDSGANELAEMVPWSHANKGFNERNCNTVFANFAKMDIEKKNPVLGDIVRREEAFVRALSGVFWAAVYSSIFAGIYVVVVGVASSNAILIAKLTLSANAFTVFAIVWDFHRQRLREAVSIIAAQYLADGKTGPPYRPAKMPPSWIKHV